MSIMGYLPLGMTNFNGSTSGVNNITYIELENAIYDELHIRGNVGVMNTDFTESNWEIDTILLAKFKNDLEAGNFQNNGVKINKFDVRRRRFEETDLNDLTIGHRDLEGDEVFIYQDFTQPRGKLVYTVVPIGDNGLEAKGSSVVIDCDFSGHYIVDKYTNNVLAFNKFLGSEPNISKTLNKGSVQIDTFSKYPSFFYNEQQYHTFSLQGEFLKGDFRSIDEMYQFVLKEFIESYKPFIAKGGDGSLYVVNIDQANTDTPMGVHSQREHMTINVSCTEIMDYKEFMEEV